MSHALSLFHALKEDLAPDAVSKLRRDVRVHFEQLVRAQARSELIALDLGEQLAARLEALLERASDLDGPSRAMVVGAARYFISDDDAQPDAASCTGLDDDVEVFNHVVMQLGRPDLLITD